MTQAHHVNGARVAMHYEVEVHGFRRRVELPFVTAVIADLRGKAEDVPPLVERQFVEVDRESFDAFMAGHAARVAFAVPNRLAGEGHLNTDLTFRQMADFEPEAVARRLDPLSRLLEARESVDESDVRQEIDRRLDAQLQEVLRHPEFRQLEATWRALRLLVSNSETGDELRIKVLHASKLELAKQLRRYAGTAWDQSPMFKRLYGDGFGSAGGEPIGCVVLGYAFDHSPPDVSLLHQLANIGEAMHAPVFAAASPAVMQFESWDELPNPRDLSKIFQTPEYAHWRSLREAESSRFLGLTLPGFLLRPPYVRQSPSDGRYRFDEDVSDGGSSRFLWGNAAFLLALNIHRAFSIHGWCARIRGLAGGGAVDDLLHITPPGRHGTRIGPTSVPIDDRRAAELIRTGFIPLVSRADSSLAVFPDVPSLHHPHEYDAASATLNARTAAQLPYVLAVSRLIHYLKAIGRDVLCDLADRAAAQAWVERWVADYVDPDPGDPSGFVSPARPFAGVDVEVVETPGESNRYAIRVQVRVDAHSSSGVSARLPA